MSIFQMYLEIGVKHIVDLKGYDHILFLFSLMAPFQFFQWKKILKLITAFTIGHSISLALSTLNIIHFSIPVIELLIPITIFLTAISNLVSLQLTFSKLYTYEYFITLTFGLIHGMGFSVLLSSLLGIEDSIILPLTAFNIGIELGQILIVSVILSLTFFLIKYTKLNAFYWNIFLSIIALVSSSYLIFDRWI